MSESQTSERLVGDRYRLLDPLGSGGMGTVWRAHDEILEREVAIKELITPPELNEHDKENFATRTFREARAAGRVSHPGVATVYDVFEENGHPWIVLELVPSQTLGAKLREDGPLPPRQVAGIALQVLAALRAAHAAGVLHRDVKPDNVLLAHDGRAVLTDFGIATLDDESSLTRTGVLIGTPAFIAPERAAGGHADRACDLWSLGVTMYVAVEGRSPFHRGHILATMAAVLHEDPAPLRRAGPLAPIIEALLCKDPRERLTSEELEPWLRGVAEGRPPEPTEPNLRVPFVPPPPRAPTSPPAAFSNTRASNARASNGAVPNGAVPNRTLQDTIGSGRSPRLTVGRALGVVLALTMSIGLIAGAVAYVTAAPSRGGSPGTSVPQQVSLPPPSAGPTQPTPHTPAPDGSAPPVTGGSSPGTGTSGNDRSATPDERGPTPEQKTDDPAKKKQKKTSSPEPTEGDKKDEEPTSTPEEEAPGRVEPGSIAAPGKSGRKGSGRAKGKGNANGKAST